MAVPWGWLLQARRIIGRIGLHDERHAEYLSSMVLVILAGVGVHAFLLGFVIINLAFSSVLSSSSF